MSKVGKVWRRSAAAVLSVTLLLLGLGSGGAPAAAAVTCVGGVGSDFNGDGLWDRVTADPMATVNGVARAGAVWVLLGGGKGVVELSQATPGVNAAPERGDQFGFSHAVYDKDQDGCSDLLVGVPYEDVGVDGYNRLDAGAVYIFHGSTSGFGAGAQVETRTQRSWHPDAATEDDRLGYALEAGTTASGVPWMAVGVPGDSVTTGDTTHAEAGAVEYVQGSTACAINQDSTNVPGGAEDYDHYGMSLASTNRFLAIGTPGEAINVAEFAGGVAVFSHTLENSCPTPLVGMDQGTDASGLSDVAEPGDQFGASISMTGYRPSGASSTTEALLAIGVPGEAIGDVASAGMVTVVRVQASGAITEVRSVDASSIDVEGDPTAGDFFGQRVTIANTDTSVVTSSDTVRLAVGVPGRDVGSVEDAGVVQVFRPLDSAPGAADTILARAASGSLLPGPAAPHDYTGISLMSGSTTLFVGVPYSKESSTSKGVLYGVPWAAVDTGSGSVTTYRPGADGIPDSGVSFGVEDSIS